MQLGRAVTGAVASGIPREAIFVTTKIPCCPNTLGNWTAGTCTGKPTTPTADINEDIKLLGGNVDLLLLHWCVETPSKRSDLPRLLN